MDFWQYPPNFSQMSEDEKNSYHQYKIMELFEKADVYDNILPLLNIFVDCFKRIELETAQKDKDIEVIKSNIKNICDVAFKNLQMTNQAIEQKRNKNNVQSDE